VITDLCILRPDHETRELTLVSLHPGVTADQVRQATGWDLRVAGSLEETPAPSVEELELLRELQAA
jgi:glutaconate CoA-transferase subunit B